VLRSGPSRLCQYLSLAVPDDEREVALVSDGTRYEVVCIEPENADEDEADALRAALRAAVGIFTPEEAEQLNQNIYRWREEGTRPIDRPRPIDRA
jgi:hypothetical protein